MLNLFKNFFVQTVTLTECFEKRKTETENKESSVGEPSFHGLVILSSIQHSQTGYSIPNQLVDASDQYGCGLWRFTMPSPIHFIPNSG